MNKIRIAYSICGEGFGHYGRSAGVIKLLSQRLPHAIIDIYCYAHAYDIVKKDTSFLDNVLIHKIPGFKFRHNKKSKIDFFRTISNWENIRVFLIIIKIFLFRFILNPILSLIFKTNKISYHLTKEYFRQFDIAVIDFEALLPRVARLRKKEIITIDNLHIMLFGKFNLREYTAKELVKFLFNKFFLKIYHPIPRPFLLTTIYDYPIRPMYLKRVKQIRPLVREEILHLKNKIEYKNYILVYLREVVKDKIIPLITQLPQYHFVVFADNLSQEEKEKHQKSWLEFYDIDPAAFVKALSRCKAVISTGGYTLISEALILQKAYFAVPLGGIFGLEQKLNLNILKEIKCGDGCRPNELSTERLQDFLANLDYYIKNAQEYNLQDSTGTIADYIIEKLDNSK